MSFGNELINQSFAASGDVSAWSGSGLSHASGSIGPDEVAGVMSATLSASATLSFTPQSTGKVLVEFWWKVTDTNTIDNGNRDTDVYLLNAGDTVASTNSCGSLKITRNFTKTPNAPNSGYVKIARRDSSDWAYINNLLARNQWHKVGIIYDFDTNTFDVVSQGHKLRAAQTIARSGAPDEVSRIAIVSGSNSQTTQFDLVRVVGNYQAAEQQLLVEHYYTGSGSVATDLPDTDLANIVPQYPTVPTDLTTYSVPTLSADGLTFDASDPTCVLYSVRPNCVAEAVWELSPAGTRWFSVIVRSYNWAGSNDPAYFELNYDSSRGSNQLRLLMGSTILTQKEASYTGTVTVSVECDGNLMTCSVDGVVELSHAPTAASTGARGLLCERHCGIGWPGGKAVDNYCLSFKGYGAAEPIQLSKTIDGRTYEITPGSIRQVYVPEFGEQLPFWSRGLSQFVHTAEHDLGEDAAIWSETMYESANLFSQRQRGWMLKENTKSGFGEAFLTITPRGLWVWETATLVAEGANWTFTPDQDFAPGLLSGTSYMTCQDDDTTPDTRTRAFANWTIPETIGTQNQPAGLQVLQSQGAAYLRTSVMQFNDTPADWSWNHGYMNIGDGTAASHTISSPNTNHSDGDVVTVWRLSLMDLASTLDSGLLSDMRADMKAPAAITVTTGTLVDDATGDLDTDGFNERFGWYELTAADNAVVFSFDGVTDRVRPQFHISNLANVASVKVDNVDQVLGTDYWWTDDGDTGIVIGFTGTLADDATIQFSLATGTTRVLKIPHTLRGVSLV